MTEFEEMLSRTLEWEGNGKLTDIPGDKGGKTKWGVTATTAQRFGYSVETLTRDQAVDVYRRGYYEKLPVQGTDENLFPDIRVKWVLFDISVNMGPHMAIVMLQQALEVTVPDGTFGSRSELAAIAYTRQPDWAEMMLAKLSEIRANRYRGLAADEGANDPDGKFLKGWLRRAADKGEGLIEVIGSTGE